MKAYLITTGTIFGLVAVMHLLKAFHDWPLLSTNPVEFLSMAALGALAALLSIWAWRLLRR
jgi:H+/Cl- antiporter ClcA